MRTLLLSASPMPKPIPLRFPALATDRLNLREVTAHDARAFGALLSIPEVGRYTNWPERPSDAQALKLVRQMSKLFADGQGCAWIIEDKASNDFVGAIRFNYFITPWKCGGIGYEAYPRFWGHGVMTEVVRAVVGCGHQKFGLNRIEAWTLAGNPASDRVLEKTGFRFEGIQRQKGWFKETFHDFRLFGRVAADPLST
jgi:ribosomal-protein-alanine N-acetyltransferase